MKSKSVIVLVAAASVFVSASAFAQEQPSAAPLPAPAAPLPLAPAPTPTAAPAPVASAHATVTFAAPPPPNQGSSDAPSSTPPSGAPIVDKPTQAAPDSDNPDDRKFLSGIRLGYSYVYKYNQPLDSLGGQTLQQKVGLRSPHEFIVGYEAMYRMAGHSWLNVILVGNVMVGGLEQSKFYPSANALIGFEFKNSFQAAIGIHTTPLKGSEAHTVFAAGWTPRVGSFYVPVHFFFVPDVDGAHRIGATTGVTW
ncbi:MAG: hypothetical protein ACXWUG_09325 [Polyangiales bacterium]